MHEPLTTSLVVELMPKLLAAFPSRIANQNLAHTAEVYRNGLRGMDGEAVRAAVNVAIENDQFFPKVARLRELASEWTRRNRVAVAQRSEASWDVCGICGARAVLKAGQAQARDERGTLLWTGEVDEKGPVPQLIATPARYHIEHDPRMHHVRSESSEGAA